ncbi:hypothetical protein BJX62DRAFT_247737 [Aspergillus germanicus]
MVGVPRSKGCLQCLKRRVKCDETRPGCLRCINYGSQCPGYNRGLKFQDQTSLVAQRHRHAPLDEAIAPSLAQSTVDLQTQELFASWMKYHFPIYAASFNCRVDVDWMDFIRTQWATFPQALVWAVRALTTLHRGVTQRDEQAIMCARHMYGRGIRHLASLLQTNAALSDETLAAAILLGGHLFCARGPAAQRRGIDAFIHAVPCFLGESQWASILLSEEVARHEEQQEKGSLLGQTMDYAFTEVAKCPGYLAAVKHLISSPTLAKVKNLVDHMLISRENLVQYNRMLETNDPPPSFIGVIPATYAGTLVQQSRDGINFAIALIDQLTVILRSHVARTASTPTGGCWDDSEQGSWRRITRYQSSRSYTLLPASRDLRKLDPNTFGVEYQLDEFSLTMGMGSLLPDACGCPQFSAHNSLPF